MNPARLASRLAKPGVSAMRPPNASKMVTSRVVWRPRPSFWLMALVSRSASGSRAFSSVDLPTPELPQKAQSRPAIHCFTSSRPSPVS